MSHPKRSKIPREPNLDTTLVMGFVICALIAAGFGYWRMGPGRPVSAQDLRFAPLKVNKRRLQAERQAKYTDAHLEKVQAKWQKLVATARKLNQIQFQADASQTDVSKLGLVLRYQANDIIPATGYDSFVVTGEPMFRECQKGLDALLAAVSSGKLSLETAEKNPPADRFAAYRANCGRILPKLVERGLVDEHGKWTFKDAPVIADLLSRYRWAWVIHDQREPFLQMTTYGATILERWRVEMAKGYSANKRQAFLAQLVNLSPHYDSDYARGVIAFENGDIDQALSIFQKLAKSRRDADFDRYVDFLRGQVDKAGHKGAKSASSDISAETEKSR